ncbi:alanine racemase [Pseudofulvimonas gallinarii]|jgi:alanine racemase|uniref:Alanine racemase n=1 Tax=Pseudofulvimonas gallinarii TaxID=634155 RepID=A0A4S3KSL8_9GAMM|nr:alanine racemase [Pseudofulvimonas gallinarii]TCT00681.1 alanine racemase [Pseudofulvimonas gallinarii]THD12040.1 alanine racemase [Pseudofulvimonas gallinarii]
MSRRVTATIHLDALRHNLAQVRARVPHSKVMAVVKADGYGHGLERVARALSDADAFGVASIADGERIRAIGLPHRVVVLSGIDEPGDVATMHALALEPVIHHESQLPWLEADTDPRPMPVWLKVDSGMHRLGFEPSDAAAVHARLSALPHIAGRIQLLSHFARSDEFGIDATAKQIETFSNATRPFDGERSLANSAAILGWPAAHADWVRAGGVLYGVSAVAGRSGSEFGFRPAMTLTARLISIKTVARGEAIGYGGSWICPEDMPIGIVAIGYGDGYPRVAEAGTPVLLRGRRAGTVGRVSMDLMSIDLRAHPDARIGDEVTLWGPELPVEEIGARAGTIGYELICGMTRRVDFVERG